MKRIFVVIAVLSFLGFSAADDLMQFTDWSAAVNLGPVVNSSFYDASPTISKSGLSLYFQSNRPHPDAQGGFDIYVSQRDSLEDLWETPANLGPTINGPKGEFCNALPVDGHWMIFTSNRPGGCGGQDLWISHRKDKRNDFGWETPVNLGCIVNSAAADHSPFLFNDEAAGQVLLYFSSNRPGGTGLLDIYVSSFSNETGTFGLPVPVAELNTAADDYHPFLRKDGLEMIFASGRPGGFGSIDLYVSTRETCLDTWSEPVNLGPTVNSAAADLRPTLSWDGMNLIFASERNGTLNSDLFMSTRTKLHPQK
jgi:hypothetical protein